jgi:lysozyme
MVLTGPDVSHYQGDVNWKAVAKAGHPFGFAKASQGMSTDAKFAQNWAGMKAAGLVRGAYHYGDISGSASAQAQHFCDLVGKPAPGDFLVLDIEDVSPSSKHVTPAQARAWVDAFLVGVQLRTGLPKTRILVYTGAWWWNPRTQGGPVAHPLWVSGYPVPHLPESWKFWTFHQYTSGARIPGITGGVDCSRYAGNLAQLKALAGLTGPAPKPPVPHVHPAYHGPYHPNTSGPPIRDVRYHLGLPAGADYDPATVAAVIAYQNRHPYLLVTTKRGIINRFTYASILKQKR